MDDLTFQQFIIHSSSYANNTRKDQRMGQAYIRSLDYHRRDLYDQLMSIGGRQLWVINPYYNDGNLPSFLGWLAENW